MQQIQRLLEKQMINFHAEFWNVIYKVVVSGQGGIFCLITPYLSRRPWPNRHAGTLTYIHFLEVFVCQCRLATYKHHVRAAESKQRSRVPSLVHRTTWGRNQWWTLAAKTSYTKVLFQLKILHCEGNCGPGGFMTHVTCRLTAKNWDQLVFSVHHWQVTMPHKKTALVTVQ